MDKDRSELKTIIDTKKVIYICVFLTVAALIVAIGFWFYYLNSSTPKKTARQFITALYINCDSNILQSCLSDDSLPWMDALEDRLMIAVYSASITDVTTINVDNDKAMIAVNLEVVDPKSVTGLDTVPLTVNLSLVKEHGAWKVDVYNSAKEIIPKEIWGNEAVTMLHEIFPDSQNK